MPQLPGVIGRRDTSNGNGTSQFRRLTPPHQLTLVALAGLVFALALVAPSLAFGQDVTTTTTTTTVPPAGEVPAPAPGTGAKPGAGKAPPKSKPPAPARIKVFVHGINKDHKLEVGKRARAVGYLKPFVAGQQVHVQLLRKGKVIRQAAPNVKKVKGANKGVFRLMGPKLTRPSTYKVIATHEYNSDQARAVGRSHKSAPEPPPSDAAVRELMDVTGARANMSVSMQSLSKALPQILVYYDDAATFTLPYKGPLKQVSFDGTLSAEQLKRSCGNPLARMLAYCASATPIWAFASPISSLWRSPRVTA